MKPITLSRVLQWRINRATYRKLGWKHTLGFMQLIGRAFFFIQHRDRAAIARAVHMVFPHETRRARQNRLGQILRGTIFHYFEKIFHAYASGVLLTRFFNTHVIDQGLAAVQRGLAAGRGVLLVTGHFGGVEFMPAYLGHCGIPTTVIARLTSAELRRAYSGQARQFDTQVIDTSTCPNVPIEAFRALKANRVVVTPCDEFDQWHPDPKARIRFLGIPIQLDRTVNVLARRSKASVVYGLMHRDHWQRYVFFATESTMVAPHMPDPDYASVGALAIKYLERFVLEFPEVWYHWTHLPELAATTESAGARIDSIPLPMIEPLLERLQ